MFLTAFRECSQSGRRLLCMSRIVTSTRVPDASLPYFSSQLANRILSRELDALWCVAVHHAQEFLRRKWPHRRKLHATYRASSSRRPVAEGHLTLSCGIHRLGDYTRTSARCTSLEHL